jgi:hypothetical protein
MSLIGPNPNVKTQNHTYQRFQEQNLERKRIFRTRRTKQTHETQMKTTLRSHGQTLTNTQIYEHKQ